MYFETENKKECNGCGACVLVCPKNCIKMIEEADGFLYPYINEEECIDCGKCKKYCGNYNNKKEENEEAYAVINKSKEILNHSSSGGMFFELAKYIIEKNGVVFGVSYNETLEAVHEYAETLEECKKFCGRNM